MAKSMFDIESDNFELYFEKQLTGMTETGKEAIPKKLYGQIFRFDGSVNTRGIRRLGFLGKLWILWRCLKKRVWVVVENEETGMSIEDFVELREAIKRRDYGIPKAEGFDIQGQFVTGGKELCDSFQYLNGLSASGAYNYLVRHKNFRKTKTSQSIVEYNYLIRFIRHYEAHKKKWILDKGMTASEWYTLLFLYDKEEALGSEIYRKVFVRAFHSSPIKIKLAFKTLQIKGYIIKHGRTSASRLQITPLGRDLVNSILNTYIINC